MPWQKKTHCPSGHPYKGDNLYLDTHGKKVCRTCKQERHRDRERRRVALAPDIIAWAREEASRRGCSLAQVVQIAIVEMRDRLSPGDPSP